MIHYIKGEDLIEHVKEYEVVLVGSGIQNSAGNGFHRKVCLNFPEVLEEERSTGYNDPRKLGTVVESGNEPVFCICFITKGRYRPDRRPDALEYESLSKCLEKVHEKHYNKKIAMTIMGRSIYEGGGNEVEIKAILERIFHDMDIYVYDYEQEDYEAENARKWHDILDQVGKISTEEYRELKKRFLWEEKIGIYESLPDCSENEMKKIIKERETMARFL